MGVERIFVSFPGEFWGNRSKRRGLGAIFIAWSLGTSSAGELARRFAVQTGPVVLSSIPSGSRPMSSVFALQRNSSTVRYCFEADAEPGLLPRALELIAKRGLVPARVFAQTEDDLMSVEIEVEGLESATAEHVGRCLGQLVGVRQLY
jgi:hypothetical protein